MKAKIIVSTAVSFDPTGHGEPLKYGSDGLKGGQADKSRSIFCVDRDLIRDECKCSHRLISLLSEFSCILQIVQNRLDRRDAIFASSEYLTEKLAYFALIDVEYRNQGVGSDKPVDDALLRVYSAILKFSSEVKKDQEENEAGKFGILRSATSG